MDERYHGETPYILDNARAVLGCPGSGQAIDLTQGPWSLADL